MGRIRCSKHGPQPVVAVCPHIEQSIDRGDRLPLHHELAVSVESEPVELATTLCNTCYDLVGVTGASIRLSGDRFSEIEDRLYLDNAICAVCLMVAREGG